MLPPLSSHPSLGLATKNIKQQNTPCGDLFQGMDVHLYFIMLAASVIQNILGCYFNLLNYCLRCCAL